MDTPAQQSLPLVVRVLEGDLAQRQLQAGQPVGVISLRGRALPKDKITFEGTQRARVDFYAGNPEGTIQESGPTELPTVLSGEWKDRYLGDGVSRQLAAVFDEVRRRGPLVEVSWGEGVLAQDDALAVGDPFTRRGILKRFKHSYEIPQQCIWEMEFVWSGRADFVAGKVMATPLLSPQAAAQDASEALSTLSAYIEAFRDFTTNRLVGAPARVMAKITDALSGINAASSAISEAGLAAQTAAAAPAQAMSQLVGTLARGADAARDVIAAFELFPAVAAEVRDDALSALEMGGNLLEVLGLARAAQDRCARGADSLGSLAAPDVIAEVRVPPGTDLREISMRYYDGDPDGWTEIANYNGLTSSRVPGPPSGPSDTAWPPIRVPRRGLAVGLQAGC